MDTYLDIYVGSTNKALGQNWMQLKENKKYKHTVHFKTHLNH